MLLKLKNNYYICKNIENVKYTIGSNLSGSVQLLLTGTVFKS